MRSAETKTVDFGTVDLPECQEQRRQAQKHKKVSVFLKASPPFGGKVNGAKIFFLGGGFLTLGKHGWGSVPKSTVFSGRGGGGGVQI